MKSVRRRAFERFAGFVCLLLAASILLALLGWLPTRRLVPNGGVPAMLTGIAVSWLASVAGAVPVFLADRRSVPAGPQHTLGSMAVRFFLLLLGILYVLLGDFVERVPFAVWVGISYLLLLPLDVRYALSLQRTE